MDNGSDVLKKLKKERSGGMPWMTILDGNGDELICSVGPKGNVGCPAQPHEIEYFVEMIKKSTEASEKELAAIKKSMTVYAKKIR